MCHMSIRHPELPPQVDHHEGHEQLDAPQVDAVEEMAGRVVVPPVRAAQRQREPGHDRQRKSGQGGHAEHVDPRLHVRRLPVGQQLARRQKPQCPAPDTRRPHIGVRVAGRRLGHQLVRAGGAPRRACAAAGSWSRLTPVPVRERDHEGQAEDYDHYADDDEIGDRTPGKWTRSGSGPECSD
jgi:hypothetical protein